MNIVVFIVIFYSLFSTSDFLIDCSVRLFILALYKIFINGDIKPRSSVTSTLLYRTRIGINLLHYLDV